MRILMIYLDMLATEYLQLGNEKFTETAIDLLIRDRGGVFYKKCYSPAPDTARSAACMWSGLNPQHNGCDGRLKWPGFFMRHCETIFSIANKNNNKCYCFIAGDVEENGLLPHNIDAEIYTKDFEKYIDQTKNVQNILNVIYLPDMHFIMDVEGYNYDIYSKANEYAAHLLDRLFGAYSEYDYIFTFGDHGFKCEDNWDIPVLDDRRTKVGVWLFRKGDSELIIDTKLRSVCDLLPTYANVLGANIDNIIIDGLSFWGEGHNLLIIEDHKEDALGLGQAIEAWEVVYGDGRKIWVDVSGKVISNFAITDSEISQVRRLLETEVPYFKANCLLWERKNSYLDSCNNVRRLVDGSVLQQSRKRKKELAKKERDRKREVAKYLGNKMIKKILFIK